MVRIPHAGGRSTFGAFAGNATKTLEGNFPYTLPVTRNGVRRLQFGMISSVAYEIISSRPLQETVSVPDPLQTEPHSPSDETHDTFLTVAGSKRKHSGVKWVRLLAGLLFI